MHQELNETVMFLSYEISIIYMFFFSLKKKVEDKVYLSLLFMKF